MAHLSLKPGTLLSPVPAALISVGRKTEEGLEYNLMTAAWVGTICSDPPMLSVSIRPSRYTIAFLEANGELMVNLTDEAMLWATDYCGVRSGRDENKFETCHLHPVPVEGFSFAPAIEESPLSLGCRVVQKQELGSHVLYLCRIDWMGVREELMDERGGLHLEKTALIAYSHGVYRLLGESKGFFGFSVAAPKVRNRRMKQLKGDGR